MHEDIFVIWRNPFNEKIYSFLFILEKLLGDPTEPKKGHKDNHKKYIESELHISVHFESVQNSIVRRLFLSHWRQRRNQRRKPIFMLVLVYSCSSIYFSKQFYFGYTVTVPNNNSKYRIHTYSQTFGQTHIHMHVQCSRTNACIIQATTSANVHMHHRNI